MILIELENDDLRSSGRFVLCHLTSESSEDHHDWVAFGVRVIGVSLAHDLQWHPRPLPDIPGVLRAGRLNKSNLDLDVKYCFYTVAPEA